MLFETTVPEELKAVLLPDTPLKAEFDHFEGIPAPVLPGIAKGGTDAGRCVLTTGTTVSK
jgi:hypothetical protein